MSVGVRAFYPEVIGLVRFKLDYLDEVAFYPIVFTGCLTVFGSHSIFDVAV